MVGSIEHNNVPRIETLRMDRVSPTLSEDTDAAVFRKIDDKRVETNSSLKDILGTADATDSSRIPEYAKNLDIVQDAKSAEKLRDSLDAFVSTQSGSKSEETNNKELDSMDAKEVLKVLTKEKKDSPSYWDIMVNTYNGSLDDGKYLFTDGSSESSGDSPAGEPPATPPSGNGGNNGNSSRTAEKVSGESFSDKVIDSGKSFFGLFPKGANFIGDKLLSAYNYKQAKFLFPLFWPFAVTGVAFDIVNWGTTGIGRTIGRGYNAVANELGKAKEAIAANPLTAPFKFFGWAKNMGGNLIGGLTKGVSTGVGKAWAAFTWAASLKPLQKIYMQATQNLRKNSKLARDSDLLGVNLKTKAGGVLMSLVPPFLRSPLKRAGAITKKAVTFATGGTLARSYNRNLAQEITKKDTDKDS